MTENIWLVILKAMILQLPNFGVGAAGLWFAFARRLAHPRVSRFAMVGFAALLMSALLFLAMQLWIQYAVSAGDGARVSVVVSRYNLVGYPLNLISLSAMGFAIFIDRERPINGTQSSQYASAA